MAKFQATPNRIIHLDTGKLTADDKGIFETEDTKVIAELTAYKFDKIESPKKNKNESTKKTN